MTQPLFSRTAGRRKGQPRKDSQQILNGILRIARSGAAWRDLLQRYGAWQTVYKRFVQWQEWGLLEHIFHDLGADADLQEISMDSTYIKAHRASAGRPQKEVRIPKIHTKTSASAAAVAVEYQNPYGG